MSMERVSEAEQGSEVVRAEPMLAMPTAKVSWFRLSGSPVLAERVLLITVCSRVERKAIPTMTGMSSLMYSGSSHNAGGRQLRSLMVKSRSMRTPAKCPPVQGWLSTQFSALMTSRITAKVGRRFRYFFSGIKSAKLSTPSTMGCHCTMCRLRAMALVMVKNELPASTALMPMTYRACEAMMSVAAPVT